LGRCYPFAAHRTNGRCLREVDGWSRRIADVADHDLGRLNWTDSGHSHGFLRKLSNWSAGARRAVQKSLDSDTPWHNVARRMPARYRAVQLLGQASSLLYVVVRPIDLGCIDCAQASGIEHRIRDSLIVSPTGRFGGLVIPIEWTEPAL
jgi:hypothetical protein